MIHQNFTAKQMRAALERLDQLLNQKVTLIVGGGGALILAHGLELATLDIDAVPQNLDLKELDTEVKKVAKDLNLPPDWLNPYFSTFSYTLPEDYGIRLVPVFQGKNLNALALGAEEMLIMKCFAGRAKDVSHARALLKKGVDLEVVEKQLEKLSKKNIPGAKEALDFFDELKDFE